MSTTTIYKCDRCGSEQKTNEQFWTIGIFARCGYSPNPDQTFSVSNKKIEVCRSCLEALGIYAKKVDVSGPKEPTIEELIREIVSRCSP